MTESSPQATQHSHEVSQVLSELATLRDQARVRAHLLSQEALQKFQDLEVQIENLELRVSGKGDIVQEKILSTARSLTHAVSELLASRSTH